MGFDVPIFASVDRLAAFLLVFMRMSGMLVAAPLFSNRSFPVRIRIWLAFMLAGVTFEIAYQQAPAGIFAGVFEQPTTAVLAVAGEIGIGWLIGFTASFLIWAAQIAGHLFAQEIGLSLAEVFDPVSDTQGSAVTQMMFTLALLAFVMMDGHHLVLVTVAKSFGAAPPGAFPFNYDTGLFLTHELGSEMWATGLRIALPLMIALLMVTSALGILARAVPEMNIFIIGFSVRILFGLVAMFAVLPFVADAFRGFVTTTDGYLTQLIDSFVGR